jgi:hypothetical protein
MGPLPIVPVFVVFVAALIAAAIDVWNRLIRI